MGEMSDPRPGGEGQGEGEPFPLVTLSGMQPRRAHLVSTTGGRSSSTLVVFA